MNNEPRVFVVDESGYISDPSYKNPRLREDLHDLWDFPFKTANDVESAVEEKPPLRDVLGAAYEDGMACPYPDPIERAEKWPESDPWDDAFFDDWYPRLTEQDLDALNQMVEKWLKEEPHWSFEEDYFDYPRDSGAFAYIILDDFYYSNEGGEDVFEQLGIELIEGTHPGNNSCSADMSVAPEEANKVCIALGIPFRFERQT